MFSEGRNALMCFFLYLRYIKPLLSKTHGFSSVVFTLLLVPVLPVWAEACKISKQYHNTVALVTSTVNDTALNSIIMIQKYY